MIVQKNKKTGQLFINIPKEFARIYSIYDGDEYTFVTHSKHFLHLEKK